MLFPGRPGDCPAVILLVPACALAIDPNVAARPCFLGRRYHETGSMEARD